MGYDAIITLALSNTHTKTGQVSASILKSAFNIARKELANTIIKEVDENYFFQIWKRDAVADQENGEYPYPKATNEAAGMSKCQGLFVKGYKDDLDFTKANEVDIKTLPKDWSWYLDNQPKDQPIYFIGDESFFVAPQFKSADLPDTPAGNNQIKLLGISKFIDLDTGALDSAILIPDDSHHRIAIGMEPWILKARGKKNEATLAFQEFEVEKQKMVDELTNRDNSGMTAKLPNDYGLGFGE